MPVRPARATLRSLTALAAMLTALVACGKEIPAGPARDNPLDARNPATGGDPFALGLEETAAAPRLRWAQVDAPGVTAYAVYRRVDDGAFLRE